LGRIEITHVKRGRKIDFAGVSEGWSQVYYWVPWRGGIDAIEKSTHIDRVKKEPIGPTLGSPGMPVIDCRSTWVRKVRHNRRTAQHRRWARFVETKRGSSAGLCDLLNYQAKRRSGGLPRSEFMQLSTRMFHAPAWEGDMRGSLFVLAGPLRQRLIAHSSAGP